MRAVSSRSLWSSSCMKHNHHSFLLPLQLPYFGLLFSDSLALIWSTRLALELIGPRSTVPAWCLQRALAQCTMQLSPPPVYIHICTHLGSSVPQVSTLRRLLKVPDLIFCPLILLFSPPTHTHTQMNNKWNTTSVALSDEQLRFVIQTPWILLEIYCMAKVWRKISSEKNATKMVCCIFWGLRDHLYCVDANWHDFISKAAKMGY